jgi:hypothetical protein
MTKTSAGIIAATVALAWMPSGETYGQEAKTPTQQPSIESTFPLDPPTAPGPPQSPLPLDFIQRSLVDSSQQRLAQVATTNPQIYYANLFDRQVAVPRAYNSYLPAAYGPGPGFLMALAIPGFNTVPLAATTIRADPTFDSTRLLPPGVGATSWAGTFLPSSIPARGEPFYGLGERANVLNGQASTHFTLETISTVSQDTEGSLSAFGIRTAVEAALSAQTDGTISLVATKAFATIGNFPIGQLMGNVTLGKADTLFSDPDAIPDTIDQAGPNAEVYLQHALIDFRLIYEKDADTWFTGAASIEMPEASATSFDFANAKMFNSRSRIPDFAAQLRATSNSFGHLQAAVILRDVGIENAQYTITPNPAQPNNKINVPSTHDDVFGWGCLLSGALHPFADMSLLTFDYVKCSVTYGEGIANYNFDLNKLGGFDAEYEGTRTTHMLKAIPMLAYYAAYTHYWAGQPATVTSEGAVTYNKALYSTVVYSEVDLESVPSLGLQGSPYRHGRYLAANIIYTHPIGVAQSNKKGSWFTGIEYLYGEKVDLNKAVGNDHRVQITGGVNF